MPKKKKQAEPTSKPSSWLVYTRETIEKEHFCANCMKEQAATDPYRYSVEVRELGVVDLEVIAVDESK